MATLRVTTGTLRGRRIPVPKDDVRPTSERARQAFFNIVGDRIQDAHFIDLFAGTGAFAFEAVSRGAASAVAVDSSRRNTEAITRLAKEWDANVATVTSDVLAFVGSGRLARARPHAGETPAPLLVYADPPYGYEHYDQLLAALDELDTDLVAIEHRRGRDPFTIETKRLRRIRRAEYGEVWITLWN
jgi:16S rRNA (guanine966-N2)-methyltransferase